MPTPKSNLNRNLINQKETFGSFRLIQKTNIFLYEDQPNVPPPTKLSDIFILMSTFDLYRDARVLQTVLGLPQKMSQEKDSF